MNASKFRQCVRDALIKESPNKEVPLQEVITRKVLKQVIKEALWTILREMPRKKKGEEIDEITVTGDVSPINLPGNVRPGWVAKRGGSLRGLAGSRSLGYELTSIGKKDFEQDKQDPVK